MADAGEVDSHDIVLEAGPGKGILTESLLACARQVIAMEKDPRLILFLSFKFKKEIASGKLKLIEGDIREFDPASQDLKLNGYKVIANIPYYLTGHFLRYFLSHETHPSRMVLMLQKEVVQRILAADGKESILSIAVKAYGTPRRIETVPAKLFTPRPNVDSAVLCVENISKKFFNEVGEGYFFQVLKTGFAHKRKQLIGNLSSITARTQLEEIFKHLEIPLDARAENLSVFKWKALARALVAQAPKS